MLEVLLNIYIHVTEFFMLLLVRLYKLKCLGKMPTCLSCCVLVGMPHCYAWTGLEDIFVCHGGHHVRLWHKFLLGLGWKAGNTTSDLTNHRSRPCRLDFIVCCGRGMRKIKDGCLHHVCIRVRAPCHPIGQHRGTCFWRCHPRQRYHGTSQMEHHCYAIRPFARPRDFICHNQII